MPQAERNEAVAGVRDERHTGVADQSNLCALLHGNNQFRRAGQFIVFVIADERLVNVIVREELLGMPRVFAGDLIDFLEDTDGAKGDVFEIADRRADEIEAAAGCWIHDLCGLGGRSLRAHVHESSPVFG